MFIPIDSNIKLLFDGEELGRLRVDAFHLEDRPVSRELKDGEILYS